MKKFLLFAVFLLTVADLYAQNYRSRRYVRRPAHSYYPPRPYDDMNKIKVGLKAGMNIANTIDAYDTRFNTNAIIGYNVGLVVEVPINPSFSLMPELLLSQKGYSIREIDVDYKQVNNFIDVPLLLKAKLTPGFSIVTGPQVSFLISTKDSYRDGYSTSITEGYDYTSNKTLLGGVVGIEVALNRNVDMHARYTIDLQNNHTYSDSFIPDYKNQVWQIGIGVRL